MSSILYFSKAETGSYSRPKKYSKRQNKKDKTSQIEKKRLKRKSSLSNFFKSPKNLENKVCDYTTITSDPNDIDSSCLYSYSILESSSALSYDQQLSNDTLTTVNSNQKSSDSNMETEDSENILKNVQKHSSESPIENIYPSLLNIEAAANILSGYNKNDKIYDSQETFIQFENPIINPLKVIDNIYEAKDIEEFKSDSKKRRKRILSQNHKKPSKSIKVHPKSEYLSRIPSITSTAAIKERKPSSPNKRDCSGESSIRTHNRILKNLTYKFGGNNVFNKSDKHKFFEISVDKSQENDENLSNSINDIKGDNDSILLENNALDNYEIDLDFSFNDDVFKSETEISKCISPMSFDGCSDTNFPFTKTSSNMQLSENQKIIPEEVPVIPNIDDTSIAITAEDLKNSSDIDSIISDFDDNDYEKETEKKFEVLANRELNTTPQEAASNPTIGDQFSKLAIFDFVKSTKKIIRFGSSGRKKSELSNLGSNNENQTQEETVHIDVPTFRNSKKASSEIFNSLITGTLHSGSLKEYTKGSTSDYSDSPDLIDIHDPQTFFQEENSILKPEKEKKTPSIQFKNTSQLFVYDKSGDDNECKALRDTDNDQKNDANNSITIKTGKSILKKRENKNIMFEKTRSYFEDMETFDDFIRKLDRSDQERMCKEIFNNKKRESQLSNYYKFYDKFKK